MQSEQVIREHALGFEIMNLWKDTIEDSQRQDREWMQATGRHLQECKAAFEQLNEAVNTGASPSQGAVPVSDPMARGGIWAGPWRTHEGRA